MKSHKTVNLLPLFFLSILFFYANGLIAQNSPCHLDDWNALKQLYNSTNGSNWDNVGMWNTTLSPSTPPSFCDLNQLYGITLNDDLRVVNVQLANNNLSGNIPLEIGKLTDATNINLSTNQLSGTIPSQFSNLASLKILNLSNNQLTGSIPQSFAALSSGNGGSLNELVLQFNNLSGCYPDDLSSICGQSYYGGFISAGNNFDATWDDFCNANAGSCSCSTNLSFLTTATHSVNNIFKAGNKITSSATVSPTIFLVYEAGNRIRLNKGFNAKPSNASSRFSAYIEPCN